MSKLLLVSAPSAAGKNYLLSALENENVVTQLISCTTRPMRLNEQFGKEYYFLTDDDFDSVPMVETREYNTEHGVWKYGLSSIEINNACENEGNYLVIVDCEGKDAILKYIEDKKLDIKTITIFFPICHKILRNINKISVRLLRSLNREGKMDSKAVDEVIRRYIDDNNKIMPHMSEYDIVLTNETMEDLQRNVKIIKSLIEK